MRICISRIALIIAAVCFVVDSLNSLSNAAAAAQPLPNIVVLLADDLGYGDVSCYNDRSAISTPNIDRLAREGMRFTDAHSPATVCTPSRYSLLTGQMAFRVPRGGTVFTGTGGPSLITADRLTLPELLKTRGYATWCVGKWHVGLTFLDQAGKPIEGGNLEAVKRIDYTRSISGGPLEHGFDSFFGTACCPTTDWLYAYIDGNRIPTPPQSIVDKSKLPKHVYTSDCRPGMIAPDFDLEDVDRVFLRKSRELLTSHVRDHADQPFFLYHAFQAVHLPSLAAKEYQGKTQAGPHGDFIHAFDSMVGELLKTLSDLKVDDNTLIIMTSDNGPETLSVVNMRADYHHDGARPWRGMKRDNWEGGHRVPFVVRWPNRVKPNSTSEELTCHTDVMATIADIVDFELPHDCAEDSFSMLPVLMGKKTRPIRPYLLHQGFSGSRFLAIRKENWKYLDHSGSGGNNYQQDPKLQPYKIDDSAPDAPGQLYNLSVDPGETRNLYNEHPDIARELKTLLEQSKISGRSRP